MIAARITFESACNDCGHRRVVRHSLNGHTTIQARVLDIRGTGQEGQAA